MKGRSGGHEGVPEVGELSSSRSYSLNSSATEGKHRFPKLDLRAPTACWLSLGAVLLLFLSYVGSIHPAGMFGYFHDDTLYFSSARAIATGRGYIIPSLPGTPRQTKYPILYSWLLSWVWKLFPVFPANIMPAIWLTAFFGCWTLLAAFQFLRKIPGIGNWAALIIVAAVAFSSRFILLNISIMSDVLFAALLLTAIVLADSALQPSGKLWTAVLTGCLAGLSADARSLGVATVAGILCIALGRRKFRQGLVIFLTSAPFVAFQLWPALTGANTLLPKNALRASDPVWSQTWLYYTNYSANWLFITNVRLFFQMLKSTTILLLAAPVQYFLSPTLQPWSPFGMAVYIALTLVLFSGIARLIRLQGWKPVHAVLLIYSAILLTWPYPQMYRFLMPFVPLFFAVFYLEGKRLVCALIHSFGSESAISERLSALMLSSVLFFVGGIALWNYARGDRVDLMTRIRLRTAMLEEKREAYEWIRANTSANTRIVTFEDVMLYLYTERQAMRLVSFPPSCCADDDSPIVRTDLSRILDVPKHIHAKYWLMSDDYFDSEGASPEIHAKILGMQDELPLAFKSREGHVRIYDLSNLAEDNPPSLPESRAASAARRPVNLYSRTED